MKMPKWLEKIFPRKKPHVILAPAKKNYRVIWHGRNSCLQITVANQSRYVDIAYDGCGEKPDVKITLALTEALPQNEDNPWPPFFHPREEVYEDIPMHPN